MGLMRAIRGDVATSIGGPFMAQLHTLFSGARPQIIEEREIMMRFRTRPQVSATDGPIDLDSGVVHVRARPAKADGAAGSAEG